MSEIQNQNSVGAKDLMVPLSIVIAGLFVGAGLYFGGGSSQPGTPLPQPVVTENTGTQKTIEDYVVEAGVDFAAVQACVDSGEKTAKIERDGQNGTDTGGQGTPWSILIGPGGKKYPINGALPESNVQQLIALARSEAGQGPGNSEQEVLLEAVNPVAADDHVKGNPNGDITIIEYSDYGCGFCARFHSTMNAIVEKNDDVAWVYRHLPFRAREVAEVSECVASLGGSDAFWLFSDSFFADQI